ncbi:MAG: Wzz/FepE/Etk N-terminal domain-containing protein, partial [Gemmataceae bacterium]
MGNPDAANLSAASDTKLPVSLTSSGEHAVVSFEPRGLEPADLEGTQPAPTGIASPLNASNLLKAFRHRWMLAVSVGAALLALFGGAVWHFVPAKYTAYALLRVSESEPEPLISDQRAAAMVAERYFENTQVALIKSRPILLAALRQPGVAELGVVRSKDDPAGWLEENLKVAFLEKTDILRVSLEGTEPKELAALVNAVKDAYMEEEVNGHRKKKLLLLENLERVCFSVEEKIHGQRTALRDLAQRLKSSDTQSLG